MRKSNFWFGMSVTVLALCLVFSGCVSSGSTYNAVEDIPTDMLSQIGWDEKYSITSYDGESVNWTGNSKDGRVFVNLPAGKHTLEVNHYYTYMRRTYYGTITFDFQPNRIYSIYCRVLVSLNNIRVPSSVEFTLTDVTDNVTFGLGAYRSDTHRFGAGERILRTAEDFFNRGNKYSLQHDYAIAIADYSEAIRLISKGEDHKGLELYEVYYERGVAYAFLGNDQAIVDLGKAIENFSDNDNEPAAYFFRGIFYYLIKEDYDNATADLSKFLELVEQQWGAYAGKTYFHYAEFISGAKEYLEEIRQKQGK